MTREFALWIAAAQNETEILRKLRLGLLCARELRNYELRLGTREGRRHVFLLGEPEKRPA